MPATSDHDSCQKGTRWNGLELCLNYGSKGLQCPMHSCQDTGVRPLWNALGPPWSQGSLVVCTEEG